MKVTRPDPAQPRVMRKRVILLSALTLVSGVALTLGVLSFTSRGDTDAAAGRAAQWHGVRVYAPGSDPPWRRPQASDTLPGHAVLLVHGLDEPGSIWDQLAPALSDAGHATLRFEYPNDQAIADSAPMLDAALRRLRALGAERVSIVAHSMGGLVTRDALTRPSLLANAPDDRSEVIRVIAIGTPHLGSPWAGLRWASELREQAERLMSQTSPEAEDLYRFSFDGSGQAGEDLRPDSTFLTDLNARPAPAGVAFTCLVGQMITPPEGAPPDLARLARTLGDGVVPVSSAALEGCDDIVHLRANHRAMIRSLSLGDPSTPPPGIQVVLDRLAGGQTP